MSRGRDYNPPSTANSWWWDREQEVRGDTRSHGRMAVPTEVAQPSMNIFSWDENGSTAPPQDPRSFRTATKNEGDMSNSQWSSSLTPPRMEAPPADDPAIIKHIIHDFFNSIPCNGSTLRFIFSRLDGDLDGYLTFDEFCRGVSKAGCNTAKAQLHTVFRALASPSSGQVDYKKLCANVTVGGGANPPQPPSPGRQATQPYPGEDPRYSRALGRGVRPAPADIAPYGGAAPQVAMRAAETAKHFPSMKEQSERLSPKQQATTRFDRDTHWDGSRYSLDSSKVVHLSQPPVATNSNVDVHQQQSHDYRDQHHGADPTTSPTGRHIETAAKVPRGAATNGDIFAWSRADQDVMDVKPHERKHVLTRGDSLKDYSVTKQDSVRRMRKGQPPTSPNPPFGVSSQSEDLQDHQSVQHSHYVEPHIHERSEDNVAALPSAGERVNSPGNPYESPRRMKSGASTQRAPPPFGTDFNHGPDVRRSHHSPMHPQQRPTTAPAPSLSSRSNYQVQAPFATGDVVTTPGRRTKVNPTFASHGLF